MFYLDDGNLTCYICHKPGDRDTVDMAKTRRSTAGGYIGGTPSTTRGKY